MDFHTKRFSFPKINDEAHDCQTRQTQLEDGTIQSPKNRFSVDFSSRTRSRHYFAASSFFFPIILAEGGAHALHGWWQIVLTSCCLLTFQECVCFFSSYPVVLHVSRSWTCCWILSKTLFLTVPGKGKFHTKEKPTHTHTNTYWRRVLGRSVSEIQLKRCPGTSCGEPSAVRQMQKKTNAVSTVFVCVCHRRSRIDWSHTPGPISNCYSVLTIKKVNKLCYKQR